MYTFSPIRILWNKHTHKTNTHTHISEYNSSNKHCKDTNIIKIYSIQKFLLQDILEDFLEYYF